MMTFGGLCQYLNNCLKESFHPLSRSREESRMGFYFWRTFPTSEPKKRPPVVEAGAERPLVHPGPDRRPECQ